MGTREGRVAPRLVLDTNVALSALILPSGRLAWLRPAWQSQSVLPLVSRATAEELIAVLHYPKFRLAAADRDDLLADYLPCCETVAIPEPPPDVPVCRDRSDMHFLELAVAGNATGCGVLDRLIVDDYRRADLITLTLDRKIAALADARLL
ncbi:MAG: putative toxin-antitoxin system toxin component, PIN family [Gammaproteobacteria bacterium]